MADQAAISRLSGLLARLLRDRAGNTLAMIAAGLVPMLAMLGGGIDMGRSYLSQSRIQQACDAGVLAARKKLGSQVVTTGVIPADVATIGNRFFNLNYRSGAYGSKNRQFAMTLETDYAISGAASVDVPTTIMTLFGYTKLAIAVKCEAKLNFSNTDVMFVLDTTGSMRDTNPGDSAPKIDILKSVVRNFYTQLQGSKSPGTRVRYGFVPYSTNVNVGYLLKSDWVVDDWNYNGRVAKDTGKTETYQTQATTYTYISGTQTAIAAYNAASCPASTVVRSESNKGTNPDGSTYGTVLANGDEYSCSLSSDGATTQVSGSRYAKFKYSWLTKDTGLATRQKYSWQYKPITQNLSFLKGLTGNDPLKVGSVNVRMYGNPSPTPEFLTASFRGCMEERSTYEINDYNNVDLSRALDLDLDLVPTPGNPDTQWRPMLNEISFEPEIWWNGAGSFKSPVLTDNDYLMAEWAGLSACPAAARKLSEMAAGDVDGYLSTLTPMGSTYHDIGMIWGGRLLSPTGLFAGENADVAGKPTNRNMIFLTDGLTAPLDLSYGTYGIEPLDQRRWNAKSPSGGLTLTNVVEKRFGVACSEVKKRNITVWVIGFGTTLSPFLTDCAGAGHFFEAKNAAELNDVFNKIATQLGDLRVSK